MWGQSSCFSRQTLTLDHFPSTYLDLAHRVVCDCRYLASRVYKTCDAFEKAHLVQTDSHFCNATKTFELISSIADGFANRKVSLTNSPSWFLLTNDPVGVRPVE